MSPNNSKHGKKTFANIALPCQIRNNRNVDAVYTETYPYCCKTAYRTINKEISNLASPKILLAIIYATPYDIGIKIIGIKICAIIAG